MKKNVNISEVKINYQLLSRFPADFLIKNLFFPLEEKDGTIAIAMPDPENLEKSPAFFCQQGGSGKIP
jgi:hypothetical protein